MSFKSPGGQWVKVNKKSSQFQTCGAVFHCLVPIVLPGPTGHPAPSLAGWKRNHWSMVLPGPYLPRSSDGASGTKGFWSLFSAFLFRKTVEGWRWGTSGRVQCGASAVHEIVGAVSPLALGCQPCHVSSGPSQVAVHARFLDSTGSMRLTVKRGSDRRDQGSLARFLCLEHWASSQELAPSSVNFHVTSC